MKQVFNIKIIFISIGTLLFLFFYIILPSCIKFNISDGLRNYFSVLSIFVTSILSIIAIILGGFYYFDKERRNKLAIMISELDKYDSIIERILYLDIKNQAELNILRSQKDKIVDVIQMAFELNVKIPEDDFQYFIALNSLVDNDKFISSNNYKKICLDAKKQSTELELLIMNYECRFAEAKKAFIKNIK